LSDNKLGRYEITDEIGRGGMSIVYRSYDARTKRNVALKALPRQFLHNPSFRHRFEREAQTIASLEHPAIVPVYDFGEEDGQPFLVMRYMPGGPLKDRLLAGPFSLEAATKILRRIGSALDYAHQQGIIHRDLKPGNILFDRFDEAYLADFGIVQLAEASSKLTKERALMGTPAYMSPEQAHGDAELDGRCDIYALGILLFEMLTAQLPYHADTPVRLMMKHVLDPVPSVREVNPILSKKVEAIIKRALAKEPKHRYPDAKSMVDDLEAVVRAQSKAPRLLLQRTRSPLVFGLGIVLLSLLYASGWLYILHLLFSALHLNLAEVFNFAQWNEIIKSGSVKGLLWGVSGLVFAGGATALFIRLRRRLPTISQMGTPSFTKWKGKLPKYNLQLARVFLIVGVLGSILFFTLAINSCVPEMILDCQSFPPDSPAPLICHLSP
jgi:serine/threonine protein kinase